MPPAAKTVRTILSILRRKYSRESSSAYTDHNRSGKKFLNADKVMKKIKWYYLFLLPGIVGMLLPFILWVIFFIDSKGFLPPAWSESDVFSSDAGFFWIEIYFLFFLLHLVSMTVAWLILKRQPESYLETRRLKIWGIAILILMFAIPQFLNWIYNFMRQ